MRWHTPLIPVLQRQVVLNEFEVNLVYIVGFGTSKLHRPCFRKRERLRFDLEVYVRESQAHS